MKSLDRFLPDALPSPEVLPVYDYQGQAVWLALVDGQPTPTKGSYDRDALPMLAIPDSQLEELAEAMFKQWGNPDAQPEYNTRHPSCGDKHNLLIMLR
jgi:hypothetical protein